MIIILDQSITCGVLTFSCGDYLSVIVQGGKITNCLSIIGQTNIDVKKRTSSTTQIVAQISDSFNKGERGNVSEQTVNSYHQKHVCELQNRTIGRLFCPLRLIFS